MKSAAVIGLQFGDEGKGRVVDWLCNKDNPSLVVRFSGGQQAGHHVVFDDVVSTDHIFANFGSGSFRRIPTYFSEFCTIDPMGILNESDILRNKGFYSNLYINSKCPVTTTFDKYQNVKEESHNKHGSCGVGVGATWQREEDHYSLLFEDLFHPAILRIKLELISIYRGYKGIDCAHIIDEMMDMCERLVSSKNIRLTNNIPSYLNRHLIFEGSQGILLDQDYGFFPHVTRSNTGMTNINKLTPDCDHDVYLVTRAYQTRHGAGPMTNRDLGYNISPNPFEQNFDTGAQGEFRISLLDVDLLKYSMAKVMSETSEKSKVYMVITCLDLMSLDYRFTVNGETHEYWNESDFISAIVEHIPGTHGVYLSRSAAGNIEEFKKSTDL